MMALKKFQQALADVGVGVNEDEYRMDVVHVGCERDQASKLHLRNR